MRQELDRHALVELEVHGGEHEAHPALAEDPLDPVFPVQDGSWREGNGVHFASALTHSARTRALYPLAPALSARRLTATVRRPSRSCYLRAMVPLSPGGTPLGPTHVDLIVLGSGPAARARR